MDATAPEIKLIFPVLSFFLFSSETLLHLLANHCRISSFVLGK